MPALHELQLTCQGEPMDCSRDHLGKLRESNEALQDREELWNRWDEDGYLFLREYLNRQEVMAAREVLLERAASTEELNRRTAANWAPITRDNPALDKVLHEGPMIEFYELFLGGPGPLLRLYLAAGEDVGYR